MNLVYEDYCRRLERGDDVDADAFAAEFPQWQTAIRRQIEVHGYLARFPDITSPDARLAWPTLGDRFLSFDLREELGRGAIARVFLATEWTVGDRLVAIKISPGGGGEAHVLGRLDHRNIVPILSVAEEEASGLSAVCMPYRGRTTFAEVIDALFANGHRPVYARDFNETLRQLMDGDVVPCGAFPGGRGLYVDVIFSLVAELADALAYTHQREMLHRDLKPSNILLSTDGVPMLLDFNLSADKRKTLSRIGGTLPYMSPEQIRQAMHFPSPGASDADEEFDVRADVYSLGVILYELLTGVQPFDKFATEPFSLDAAQQLLDCQRRGVLRVSRINPEVDRQACELVASCVSFDVSARPSTATELAIRLRELLDWRSRSKRWIRCHAVRSVVAAFALGMAIVLGAIWYVSQPSSWQIGVANLSDGNYPAAIVEFEKATMNAPENGMVWFGLAKARRLNGEAELAIKNYEIAYKRIEDPRILSAIAYCHGVAGSPDIAGERFKQAIEAGDDDAATHYNRAVALGYTTKHAWHLAIDCCSEAIERDQDFAEAYYLCGRLQFLLAEKHSAADFGKAFENLSRAAEMRPEFAHYHFAAAKAAAYLAKESGNYRDVARTYLTKSVGVGIPAAEVTIEKVFCDVLGDDEVQLILNGIGSVSEFRAAPTYRLPALLQRDLPADYEADWQHAMAASQ